jgi:hypothetical protein
MYRITDLHIELTDKCQASCPMCGRNKNGGVERPFVGQHEVTPVSYTHLRAHETLS